MHKIIRRRKLVCSLMAGTAAAAAVALLVGPASAAGAWQLSPTPKVSGGYSLEAVTATSDNDVWAVGFSGSNGGGIARQHSVSNEVRAGVSSVAMHWDGKAWTQTPTPQSEMLFAVGAVSASDVWAVGEAAGGGYAAHWNGKSWAEVATPQPTVPDGDHAVLKGVSGAAANDVWAVGCASNDDESAGNAYAQHWDGSAWKLVALPAVPQGTDTCLSGITAHAPNDVWAVGRSATASKGSPLTMHWDGTKWSVVSAPALTQPDADLSSVAVSGNDVWAAGFAKDGFGDPTSATPLLLHWNGKAWDVTKSPATKAWIYGLSVNGGGAYAAGYTQNASLLLKWDGKSWTPVDVPTGAYAALFGAVGVPGSNTSFAVGSTGDDVPQGLVAVSR